MLGREMLGPGISGTIKDAGREMQGRISERKMLKGRDAL